MSTMIDSLREVPLFADLSTRDLKRLADSMRDLSFAPGKQVVAENTGGAGFFVILEGAARVTQGGEERGVLAVGDYFGEMALIDGDDRSASVHAEGELRCAAMTQWTFRPFVKDHPDVAWALLTALVKRVRESQAREVGAAR
ncbi:MAG TPA: cyclic nucleotide-binding domain-containing protein [Solirubrobacteraceae bacterium]|nr:cyclic nucleotide-binding domain-containing protein [Solirubrobacteraceae bacterium]